MKSENEIKKPDYWKHTIGTIWNITELTFCGIAILVLLAPVILMAVRLFGIKL